MANMMANKTTEPDMDIKQIVKAAGGGTKLSAVLGVGPSAVSQWTRVPAEHVLTVERLSSVSRHELRPDIFGKPKRQKGRAA